MVKNYLSCSCSITISQIGKARVPRTMDTSLSHRLLCASFLFYPKRINTLLLAAVIICYHFNPFCFHIFSLFFGCFLQGPSWRDDEMNGHLEPSGPSLGLGKISEQKGILGPGPADLRFPEAL